MFFSFGVVLLTISQNIFYFFVSFQEDVDAYLKNEGNISIEEGVRRLETVYRKYKQVEQQMTEQKLRYLCGLVPQTSFL